METRRMSTGRLGEDVAARFLADRGARIIGRNVRVGHEEIDLIVEMGGQRVAVEVKTAASPQARPEENFDADKERHVRNAARRLNPPIHRVDLVTVILGDTAAMVRWLQSPD